jgi:hypothetical protein
LHLEISIHGKDQSTFSVNRFMQSTWNNGVMDNKNEKIFILSLHFVLNRFTYHSLAQTWVLSPSSMDSAPEI